MGSRRHLSNVLVLEKRVVIVCGSKVRLSNLYKRRKEVISILEIADCLKIIQQAKDLFLIRLTGSLFLFDGISNFGYS